MENQNVDICEMELQDKISHCLNTFSHVVTGILSYVNAQDLNRCSRVCILWSKVARKLKQQRQTRAWTCLKIIDDDSTSEGEIAVHTKQFFQNLYTEPKIVFMFCQSDFNESFVDNSPAETVVYTTSRQRQVIKQEGSPDQDFGEFVRKLLPSSCTFVGIGSSGVVGTAPDLSEIYEVENQLGVSFLCLPHYAGVEVICDDTTESAEDLSESSLNIGERMGMPDRDQCKAVLSFISDPYLTRQIGFDMMSEFTNSLIAGGYVDTIFPTDSYAVKVLKCVALCGENIDLASCVIRENVNTPRKVEEAVKKLKSHKLSETNSFALMFACVGRGSGMYNGESDVESSIFKKHFPKTPLFGFFGNGEIGFEFVSKKNEGGEGSATSEMPEKKKKKSPPRLYHAYTTILVLISIR